VVRVDLHGEVFFGKEELNEQGKTGAVIDGGTCPVRFHRGPSFAELLARERTIGEPALEARHPGFAYRFAQIGLFRKQRRERKRAPGTRAKNGLQARRREVHFPLPKKRVSRRKPSSIRSIEVA